jgi:ParB-like chromosome segregation protein Spo0J
MSLDHDQQHRPLSAIKIGQRHRRDMGDIPELAASIEEFGRLLHPVVITPDGTLIAGERPILAYKHLGRSTIPVTAIDLDMVVRGEYAENVFRKAFTPSEAVAIADEIEPLARTQAKRRQGNRTNLGKTFPQVGKSRALDQVAKTIGVSRISLGKARAVVEAAKVDPATYGPIHAEMDKTNKIDGAFKQLVRLRKAADLAEKAKHVPSVSERHRLVVGSVTQLLKEPAASIDLIVTDPPYEEAVLPLYSDLIRGAAHVLKPGGLLICMTGQAYHPQVIRQLEHTELQYLWMLTYLMPGGGTRVYPAHVADNAWKPVLVYCKGKYTGEWPSDVVKSDMHDKDHHKWGQSLSGMHDLMRRFVEPGDVVCDPFLGGGTTAVIALELKATFLGFDIDPQAIETTKGRLAPQRAPRRRLLPPISQAREGVVIGRSQ